MRAQASRYDSETAGADGDGRFAVLMSRLRERPKDSAGMAIAVLAVLAVTINALFLQSGPHPAPIFAPKPEPAAIARTGIDRIATPGAGYRSDTVAKIQRELARRGFYDGAVDGVYGPRTDIAIRDFEAAASLRPSVAPNDALLHAIARSKVQAVPLPPPRDPIAALLVPDRRVVAVQRVLADFGYGQIGATGIVDPETRAAIERFEREHKLPVTGRITSELTRQLSVMSGRPLE